MSLIYNVLMHFFGLLFKLATPFNEKAKKWVDGRKNWKKELSEFSKSNVKPVIWIHAASLGEFEQGRPIIEAIRGDHPRWSIVLSFFSPSGYEIRQAYDQVDHVTYLPLDTKSNAQHFITTIKPKIVIFVKYEFWPNYLNTLQEQSIPHYLVSGIFRENQHFFKWYGGFFRKQVSNFKKLFVQDVDSKILLENIGLNNVAISGDTRFDRVLQIKNAAKPLPIIKKFTVANKVIIMGSSWPQEEQHLLSFIENNRALNNLKYIVAPHEINQDRINRFMEKCVLKSQKYSSVSTHIDDDVDVLILDSIGILSSVYAFSDIAIIGGGFDAGIHNVLEAAVWQQPVLFGPNYHQFREAKDLIIKKGAFSYANQDDLAQKLLELLGDNELLSSMSKNAAEYCEVESGATQIIMKSLQEELND